MTTPEIPPEMAAAAREFAVNEAADAKRLEQKAASVEGGAETVDAGAAATSEKEAQQAAAVEKMMANAGSIVWTVLDRVVVKFAGAEFALEPGERAQLAEATAPVLDKYLPGWLQKFVSTPEGQLALVAAMVYGPKALAVVNAPASSSTSTPEQPKAPEATP